MATTTEQALLYLASAILQVWVTAHLVPTRNIIKDFGDISRDNQRIVAMEWVNEGLTLVYMGILIITVTALENAARAVYIVTFGMLNAMSILSLLTGFRIKFLPFRLCPIVFTTTSILIIIGGLLATNE